MREIKFRAWLKGKCSNDNFVKNPRMIYDVILNKKGYYSDVNPDGSWFIYADSPIMQFTGLKDKNGVEIYENDILSKTYQGILGDKTETFLRSAMWDKNNACFILSNDKNCLKTIKFQADGWEVIGNIYENPELLNKEQDNERN